MNKTAAGASITWVGHATALIELDGVRLITDPVVRDRVGPLVRIAPSVDVDGLRQVDCILLSHLHYDHTDLPSLRALGASVPILAPAGAASWLTRRGLRVAHELRAGERATIGALSVTATPANHARRRRPLGPAADPVGYLVRGSRAVYFAGDTDIFPEMASLAGSVDVALLPVWGWGSRLGSGHLDPERAADVAALISPGIAIPIHWGTLALGWPARRPLDPALPARTMATLTKNRAPGVDVRVLMPSERTELAGGRTVVS